MKSIIPLSKPLTWIAVIVFGFSTNVAADTTMDWNAGQEAFQQGNYSSALHYFQSAERSGQDGSAIQYNIAVCHFKLNDFDQARDRFRYLAERFPKMRGLAEYNLGLVARRVGNSAAARQHFLHAYALSPKDEKLRILSSRRLRDLEPEQSPASNWTGAFGLRVGNDDNVALRDELGLPTGTSAESSMVDVFGSIRSPRKQHSGFRFDGSAYLIKYFDADEFDQADFRGRIFYEWNLNDWLIEFGAHGGAGLLGGDAFDEKTGADGRAIWYLSRKSSIDLRYTYDQIDDADPVFAGIKGSRQQFDARYRWYSDGHRVVFRYWNEANDRDDPGVSPSRNRFGIDYRYQPDEGWGYEASIYIRNSDYDDLAISREEELVTARAGLTHVLDDDWLVMLDYRFSDNDASDQAFSYDRTQITLGITKLFLK